MRAKSVRSGTRAIWMAHRLPGPPGFYRETRFFTLARAAKSRFPATYQPPLRSVVALFSSRSLCLSREITLARYDYLSLNIISGGARPIYMHALNIFIISPSQSLSLLFPPRRDYRDANTRNFGSTIFPLHNTLISSYIGRIIIF